MSFPIGKEIKTAAALPQSLNRPEIPKTAAGLKNWLSEKTFVMREHHKLYSICRFHSLP